MEVTLIVISIAVLLLLLYLNFLASICLILDPDIEPIQKWGQLIFAWVVPFIGAPTVLHLVFHHSPEVVKRFYIPRPFRGMVLGKALRKSKYGNNYEEIPGLYGAGVNNNCSTGSGESSGGGD